MINVSETAASKISELLKQTRYADYLDDEAPVREPAMS